MDKDKVDKDDTNGAVRAQIEIVPGETLVD